MPSKNGISVPAFIREGIGDERDPKGFLVAWVTARTDGGAPIMGKVDAGRVLQSMVERRCQTCSLPISEGASFGLVGEVNAAWFFEPPIHLECCVYSIQVCPHLLRSRRALEIVLCSGYEVVLPGSRRPDDGEVARKAACRPIGNAQRFRVDELIEQLSGQPPG